MPHLNCPQLKRTFEINSQESLMENLLSHNIPVASSCGGEGICGKCRMEISTLEKLAKPSDLEKKTLEKNNAKTSERLSCQIYIHESASLKTNYW